MHHFRCVSCGGINRIPTDKVQVHPKCGRCRTPLDTSGGVIHLDDDQLEALVAKSPVPVLVDVYADWCGPCKVLGPVLDQLGKRHAGQLFVAKIDTERHRRFAASFGVQSIPAVFLFKDGELVDKEVGAHPPARWARMVAPHLT